MPALGLSLGVPFRHLSASAFAKLVSEYGLQYLVGTTDGQTIDDSVDPLKVDPEPTVVNVSCATFDETQRGTVYLPVPVGSTVSLETIFEYKSTGYVGLGMPIVAYLTVANTNLMGIWIVPDTTHSNFRINGNGTNSDSLEDARFTDGEWHTVRVEVTLTTRKMWFDDDVAAIIDDVGVFSYAQWDEILIAANSANNRNFNGELRHVKSINNPLSTPKVLFESRFEQGSGQTILTEDLTDPTYKSSYLSWDQLGLGGVDSFWSKADMPSFNLLNGCSGTAFFDGANDYLYYAVLADATTLDKIEMYLFVTGEIQQISGAPSQGPSYDITINAGAGGDVAVSLNDVGGGIISGPHLDRGWHRISIVYIGGTPSYTVYIDGVDQVSTGNLVGYITLGGVGPAFDSGPIDETYMKEFFVVYSGETEERYLIKAGQPDGGPLASNLSPAAYMSADLDWGTEPLSFDGGYVHNQADINLIQQDYNIVDVVYVTDNVNGLYGILPLFGEFNGTGRYLGQLSGETCVVVLETAPDQWEYGVQLIGTWSNPKVGPLPPKEGWSADITIQHGYFGSFWADEDGEYEERSWYDLINHQTMDENLCALYEKSIDDNCQLKELVQFSLALQFTPEQRAVITAWQGDSGCEIPSFPGFDSGFDNGSG